jgi:hypothetical protein
VPKPEIGSGSMRPIEFFALISNGQKRSSIEKSDSGNESTNRRVPCDGTKTPAKVHRDPITIRIHIGLFKGRTLG